MNRKKLIPVFVISILLLSSVVFAAGTISITDVTIPSSVAQGDSFTITMSVYGSQVTDVYGSLTLPSGISCTPTGSQLISLGAGGTGSASWSCTADVAGDYSNKITASVTAKDSGTGATLSDNEQTGLMVLSPASITISSAISSGSITTAESATFTVGVNNVGDVATTFNISLSPSGVTFSPSSYPNTNIDGNSLKNVAFTVSCGTTGTYTLTATVSAYTGQTLTTSKNLTITVAPTAPTTPTTPIFPGGDTTPPNITIDSPTNTTYSTASVWANISLSEAGPWCGYSLDTSSNITMSGSDTSWYKLLTDLSNGSHNIKFYCNDSSGNMGSSSLRYFTVNITVGLPECPVCANCTEWSDCVNNTQTRTCYNCSAETNYTCVSYTETSTCGIAAVLPTLLWVVGIIVVVIIIAVFVLKKYKKPKKI